MFRALFLILIFLSSITFAFTTIIPFAEVLKADKSELKKVTENFQKELDKKRELQGYILNYGTDKEIARREKIIRNSIKAQRFDASRITIVNAGDYDEEAKTVFFLVPLKATPPTPNEEIK